MSRMLAHWLERRVPLGASPTAIVPFESLTRELGIEVDLKRDDWLGDQLTGTKLRALSYVMGQATADGVTDLVTIGEPTSNQCRLVAILAARHGMAAHIFLRASRHDGIEDDNVAIMRLHGAQIDVLDEAEWRLHGLAVKRRMRRIQKAGGKAQFVPFGCGGLPGALGMIDLAREISSQRAQLPPYTHFIIPTGSGTTLFGLDLAMQLLEQDPQSAPTLVGVSVEQDAPTLLRGIDQFYAKTRSDLSHEAHRSERVVIEDHLRGLSPAAMVEQLARVVQTYKILFDPLYVLRGVLALEHLVQQQRIEPGSRALMLVSGACRTLSAVRRRAGAKEPNDDA